MSFTRFHDDPSRIKKENIETSMQNQYIFNVPGNTKTLYSGDTINLINHWKKVFLNLLV